jgi:hypothetical protein
MELPMLFAVILWVLVSIWLVVKPVGPMASLGISIAAYMYSPSLLNLILLDANAIRTIHQVSLRRQAAASDSNVEGASVHVDISILDTPLDDPAPWLSVYKGLDLGHDNIRVLLIQPEEDRTKPLHCSILVAPHIDWYDEYTALSYNWGTSEKEQLMEKLDHDSTTMMNTKMREGNSKQNVDVGSSNDDGQRQPHIKISRAGRSDDLSFPVTMNLYEALVQMREHNILTIWVDAICINQLCEEEMDVEVKRMFDIYEHASEVAVWLGTEADKSNLVMDGLSAGKDGSLIDYDRFQYKTLDVDFRYAVDQFLTRPYWRRAWIVQEIAAGTRVQLYCGDQIVPWENIESLSREWRCNVTNVLQGNEMEETGYIPPARLLYAVREQSPRQNRSKTLSLLQMLAKTSYAQATKPHDKVFSLLGLSYDWEDYLAEPNYKTPIDVLCRQMTRQLIYKEGNLDIILLGPKVRRPSALPSWCPNYFDFATESPEEAIVKYLAGHMRYRSGRYCDRWNTTEESRHADRSALLIDSDRLTVIGRRLGRITALGCTLSEDDRHLRQTPLAAKPTDIPDMTIYSAITRLLLTYSKLYESPPGYLSFLAGWPARYLLATLPEWNPEDARMRRLADSVWSWVANNKQLAVHGTTLGDRTRTAKSNAFGLGLEVIHLLSSGLPQPVEIIFNIYEILAEGLRLMTIESGGYVGLVHPRAALWDEVYLIEGCSLPVVLRRRRKDQRGYTIVGHAYIEGVMNGELWKQTDDKHSRCILQLY